MSTGPLVPFTVLDPGFLPGRPAMDGTTDRVLRGFMYAILDENTLAEVDAAGSYVVLAASTSPDWRWTGGTCGRSRGCR